MHLRHSCPVVVSHWFLHPRGQRALLFLDVALAAPTLAARRCIPRCLWSNRTPSPPQIRSSLEFPQPRMGHVQLCLLRNGISVLPWMESLPARCKHARPPSPQLGCRVERQSMETDRPAEQAAEFVLV